jgi:4-carboxymuconolactone decarboxylase
MHMFLLALFIGFAVLITAIAGGAQPAQPPAGISISSASTRTAQPAPEQYFTGQVQVEMLPTPPAPARVSAARVTFQPGARTAWHTHPLGQVLIVTAGEGRVQEWGGPVRVIRPGDVVTIAPGVKHWHGAAPGAAMTHLAIQEQLYGRAADWMEKVSDEQYRQ